MSEPILLKVEGLTTTFTLPRSRLFEPRRFVPAVDSVDLELASGSTLGLVGESGSGKSTTAMSILRLIEPSGGKVLFRGEDILALSVPDMRRIRQKIQIIFQDPYSSLNPKWRVEDIVREPLDVQNIGTEAGRSARVCELLELVGLRADHADRFPAAFSGGQRQRIAIARALATAPDLLVCDEVVSALDVAVQAKILNLMKGIQETLGISFLFISHDLSVIYHMCTDIAVMYLGTVVERAPRANLYGRPLHPYTSELLSAVPRIGDWRVRVQMDASPRKEAPSALVGGFGCKFVNRCAFAVDRCKSERPMLRRVEASWIACHRVDENGQRTWNYNEDMRNVENSTIASG
jgi:peptide/nickel transport system ATP-binding protein